MNPAAWQVQTANSKAFFGGGCAFGLKRVKPRIARFDSSLTNRITLTLNSPDLEDFEDGTLQILFFFWLAISWVVHLVFPARTELSLGQKVGSFGVHF